MKIHHSLALCLFLALLTTLWACQSDPIAERNATPPQIDTSNQNLSLDDMDKADLKELLEQYEPPGRNVWQKPERVINKMNNLENKVVADLGAGGGAFSLRLAQHAKKVIALDIDPRMVEYIDSVKMMELKPEYRDRLETRIVTPTDSRLNPGEADVILIVNTYILIKDRKNYLRHLWNVLPEGGQIIIVDFKKKRIPIKLASHKMRLGLYEVENELTAAGFFLTESDDCSLEYQYIVTAEK